MTLSYQVHFKYRSRQEWIAYDSRSSTDLVDQIHFYCDLGSAGGPFTKELIKLWSRWLINVFNVSLWIALAHFQKHAQHFQNDCWLKIWLFKFCVFRRWLTQTSVNFSNSKLQWYSKCFYIYYHSVSTTVIHTVKGCRIWPSPQIIFTKLHVCNSSTQASPTV